MWRSLLFVPLLASTPLTAAEPPPAHDPETGFVMAEGWHLVKATCTPCHSARLVTQNRMNGDGWRRTIRWMQEKHNLWDLGQLEQPILKYLEAHYNIHQNLPVRRKNLPQPSPVSSSDTPSSYKNGAKSR